jgi:pimeloyl-ACP methyl ester carboxylesterase
MTTRPDTRGFNSRREFLFTVAGGMALASAAPGLGFASQSAAQSDAPPASAVPFVEHRISHDGHMIYALDNPGRGPAYVLLHGFPDNLHIYDYVVPYLTAAGRRVVVFDFLGFGQSEKVAPGSYHYNFDQQVGDLSAVVDALKVDKFIPVGHDSGGPCAANYALDHPGRVAWLCLMNTYYAASPTLRFPELIELFGDPALQALAKAFAASPDQMAWLLKFQNQGFQVNMPPNLKDRFNGILQPIIDANFAGGAAPAFMQMTSHLRESVAYNTKRLPEAGRFAPKVNLIWGVLDPYLTPGAADAIASIYPHATVKPVQAGHWLMIDAPEQVANLLLAGA